MRPGEAFERRCYEYLKSIYKDKNVTFEWDGGMDSTVSDIAVVKNNYVDFYIEVKDSNAQSGQFVLLANESERRFIFSPGNKSEENDMTDIIIDYMNNDFDRFNNAGTAGAALDIDNHVFSSWIIDHYSRMNAKYFISCYHGDFVIFPIRCFDKYFDVVSTYRVKKSGSTEPAKRDFPIVKNIIEQLIGDVRFCEEGKKLYVELNSRPRSDRFKLGDYTYYFSDKGNNRYEIKRLSNTYNMNVIFGIELKRGQDPVDRLEFEADL